MQSDKYAAAADCRSACMTIADSSGWEMARLKAACVLAEHQKRRGSQEAAVAGVRRAAAGA